MASWSSRTFRRKRSKNVDLAEWIETLLVALICLGLVYMSVKGGVLPL